MRAFRVAAALALIVTVGIGATACAPAEQSTDPKSSETDESPSTESTEAEVELRAATKEELARYAEARRAVKTQPGIAITTTVGSASQQLLAGEVLASRDLLSWKGDFESASVPISIIKVGEIAWIRAPQPYWAAAGVDAETAEKLGESMQFGAFSGKTAEALTEFADVTAFLQTLETAYDLDDPQVVASGERKGQFMVELQGARHFISLSDGETPWIGEVFAEVQGGGARIVKLSPTREQVEVLPPETSQVYQGKIAVSPPTAPQG